MREAGGTLGFAVARAPKARDRVRKGRGSIRTLTLTWQVPNPIMVSKEVQRDWFANGGVAIK